MALRGDARTRRIDFDDLALLPARRVTAEPADCDALDDLVALAAASIPQLAAAAPAVRRVYRHNPNAVWDVRGSGRSRIGTIALLLLNAEGMRAMLDGALDSAEPDTALLAGPGESAAAVYLWAVALPSYAIEGLGIVSLWLRGPLYAAADVYTRAATPSGERITLHLGFEPMPELGLYRFRRHRNRTGTATAVA